MEAPPYCLGAPAAHPGAQQGALKPVFTQVLGGERRKSFLTCTAPERDQLLLQTLFPSLNPNLKLTSSHG